MDAIAKGQVTRTAADVYEEFFVPAIFGEWAAPLCDAAGVAAGQRVLDVACGTGVAAREAARRIAPDGRVVGLDVNDGMLDVARRNAPDVDWQNGRAEAIPFDDAAFDSVLCQFGLMFFEDRAAALAEMYRVLRPGGQMAVAVWDSLSRTPGYAAVVALLDELFGKAAADSLRAPFILGEPDELRALFASAGLDDVGIQTREGSARFPSIEAWVHTDVKGWTLADMIDDAQYETLLARALADLRPFTRDDGSVAFASPAHIVTVAKG